MATKPPVLPVWGETNTTAADMVQPTNPQIQAGWPLTTTPPSRQRFNWILNFVANAVRYFSRAGLPDYDAAETYSAGDITRGDNGLIYRSLVGSNLNFTPSSSPTKWGSPLVPTPAADDDSTKTASTAYVLGQISVTTPAMDGAASVGSSKKFARADHVHPSDSSKANTSGSYSGLSVGFASVAGAAPWSGVTGKPTSVAGYGITDAIHTGNIGSQSVAYATNAGRAYPNRWDGAPIALIWSGQGGQPNWLLGGNDGVNFYVYNPANFSVNQATYAYNSSTQPAGTSNTAIATTQFANPAQLRAASGYVMLPGGLIFQWMHVALGNVISDRFSSATWPITFPNACLNAQATLTLEAPGSNLQLDSSVAVYSENTAGVSFTVQEWSSTDQNLGVNFFAVGY